MRSLSGQLLLILCFLFISLSCKQPTTTTSVSDREGPETEVLAPLGNVKMAKHPKNIILMIGDGMGLTQITAGMIANGNKLHLERCTTVGLIKTSSSDNLITDSAAGATAFASGVKTYNGAIGVDPNKKPVPTLVEIASRNNISTGLVASSSITHATPASFIAHQPSRKLDEGIARDLVNSNVDVFMGGGRNFFDKRTDSLDLVKELEKKNYKIYNSLQEVKDGDAGRIGVFIAPEQPQSFSEGRADFLPMATERTIDLLNKNENFFLMVEGSQIDWKGHSNESEELILEMIDFDKAIGEALDFAEKDGETLVIITADHETGGYSIVGGDQSNNTVLGKFNTGSHTAVMVPVFAFGPGAEEFSGIYENTQIFHKILEIWRPLIRK